MNLLEIFFVFLMLIPFLILAIPYRVIRIIQKKEINYWTLLLFGFISAVVVGILDKMQSPMIIRLLSLIGF
ncbi:hypothetical protein HY409_03500 [Candidatus Gottesmanbacteria bacterium]|nr:hypothetical protein [Candidatus Gottesmanbacteria bacterium]